MPARNSLLESSEYLLQRFKTILEKEAFLPVVRTGEVKDKKAGKGEVRASAHIPGDVADQTGALIEKKGRALIPVAVTVSDGSGTITMTAACEWFVQKA